jgi:dinuclear metal center YbgI/SA1388 family protein
MKIRFIFFDLGNVLLRFSTRRLARQAAEVAGCSEDEILHAVFGNGINRKIECGEISDTEFYESFCRSVGKRPDPQQLENALNDMFEVVEEMQPVLRQLVADHFPRGILSNTGAGHWNHCIKKYPFLLQYFPDNHILSYQVGAMKPDKKIYEAAFQTAENSVPNIQPDEILFIDDLESNILGAKTFGFDAVQFISEQQLLGELAKRGLVQLNVTDVNSVSKFLDAEYPAALAEDWDNVGLLIGDFTSQVRRLMTCLTITPTVCNEAVQKKVDLIVSHHPFPFFGTKRITSESTDGSMLLKLISHGIAVYSPHTAHDSAPDGVNRQLATLLELVDVEALNANGSGRIGNRNQPATLAEMLSIAEQRLGACSYVGALGKRIRRIAVGCGAADEFIAEAARQGADLLLLGEARFHACLQAESLSLALILPGHFASERFAVETLADKIAARFPDISCFASVAEQDILKRF